MNKAYKIVSVRADDSDKLEEAVSTVMNKIHDGDYAYVPHSSPFFYINNGGMWLGQAMILQHVEVISEPENSH